MKTFKVKYIGEDMVEIRKGDVCEAYEPEDTENYYGVYDRSGEDYAYPKQLFEIVE